MTDIAAGQRAKGVVRRVSAWIGRLQQQLSDRLHADGDALARERGWTVTTTTGRLGFGGRVYRDARFDQLAAHARRGESRETRSVRDDGVPRGIGAGNQDGPGPSDLCE
jgi:hypothetical protein